MSKPFLIIFFLCLFVALCVIAYIAKRNPDPRFRPRFGELVLMGLIGMLFSGGVSYLLSNVFEDSDRMTREKMESAPVLDRRESSGNDSRE
ncbi:hypothetical protein OAV21_02280 [bacterium]|jgi:hypothetical protein|nr:hypothetical protein [Verrucomicrobiales bacterium]MDC3255204.1 hypothetical protein [bacterium]